MSQSVVDAQRRHWDAVAAGWAAWLEWTERNFAPVTDWLADAAGWTSGRRILDVACGTGYPALTAAARVAPYGQVTATDLSCEMIARASQCADARGLRNVEFKQMESEQLDYDAASFDAVSNVYGLMFSPDPVQALREARRVLKPGGRLAIVVWDEFGNNPFFNVISDVGRSMLGLRQPDPSTPGPFRFAQPATLEEVLRKAGFRRWRIDTVSAGLQFVSADEYFQVFRDVAWKSRIDALSPDDLAAFKRGVADAARSYESNGRLLMGTSSLCAFAEQ